MSQLTEQQPTKAWVPSLPTDTFAQRLRYTRLVLGLSVTEMANSIGVPEPTLGTWEKGVTPRSLADVVERLYRAHGVSANWLMWGSVTLGKQGKPPLELVPPLATRHQRSEFTQSPLLHPVRG